MLYFPVRLAEYFWIFLRFQINPDGETHGTKKGAHFKYSYCLYTIQKIFQSSHKQCFETPGSHWFVLNIWEQILKCTFALERSIIGTSSSWARPYRQSFYLKIIRQTLKRFFLTIRCILRNKTYHIFQGRLARLLACDIVIPPIYLWCFTLISNVRVSCCRHLQLCSPSSLFLLTISFVPA